MTFAYVLLLLIPIFAVAYIVWDYRRKTAQRDAANAERLHDVIGAATQVPRPQNSGGGLETARDPASIVSYVGRERLLTPPQTLLYYLLRSGLPDHVVFPLVTLASVLDTAPAVAEHARREMTRRLADQVVDFVITDKRMRPLTVLKLIGPDYLARNELSSTKRWVVEAGLRYVEVDSRQLPRKEAIREVVLGEAPAGQQVTAAAAS
jgi:hypothetical protein